MDARALSIDPLFFEQQLTKAAEVHSQVVDAMLVDLSTDRLNRTAPLPVPATPAPAFLDTTYSSSHPDPIPSSLTHVTPVHSVASQVHATPAYNTHVSATPTALLVDLPTSTPIVGIPPQPSTATPAHRTMEAPVAQVLSFR